MAAVVGRSYLLVTREPGSSAFSSLGGHRNVSVPFVVCVADQPVSWALKLGVGTVTLSRKLGQVLSGVLI